MLLDQDPTVLIIHEVYYALPCPDKLTTPKGFEDNNHNIDDDATSSNGQWCILNVQFVSQSTQIFGKINQNP